MRGVSSCMGLIATGSLLRTRWRPTTTESQSAAAVGRPGTSNSRGSRRGGSSSTEAGSCRQPLRAMSPKRGRWKLDRFAMIRPGAVQGWLAADLLAPESSAIRGGFPSQGRPLSLASATTFARPPCRPCGLRPSSGPWCRLASSSSATTSSSPTSCRRGSTRRRVGDLRRSLL
jgi:hypothetical protein